MRFRKYSGMDKYHFRVYKKSIGHLFIVAVTERIDENGKVFISGYMMAHSLERAAEKPSVYRRMKTNPNPSDERPSFVNKYRVNDVPAINFSKPYNNWHLSKEDERLIDSLEAEYSKK